MTREATDGRWRALAGTRLLERVALALADLPTSPCDRFFHDDLAGADRHNLQRERERMRAALLHLPRQHPARRWIAARWHALNRELGRAVV